MPWADSEPASATLALRGVHLHDPELGAQASASVFPYGADSKEDTLDVQGVLSYYAGRQDPVTDFGEHQGYGVSVTIEIPHGPTYIQDLEDLHSWAARKRVIHYRDGRSRALYGTLANLTRRDAAWGSTVSFTVTQNDRASELIST